MTPTQRKRCIALVTASINRPDISWLHLERVAGVLGIKPEDYQ